MPAPRRWEVRFNPKALLMILAIAVPLLMADLFFVLDRSQRAFTSGAGDYLTTIAQVTASEVSRFVRARVFEVQALAAHEEIRRTAASSNQSLAGLSEEAARIRLLEIDRDWKTPRVSALVQRALSNAASVNLREYLRLSPSVAMALVTDAQGAFAAGSHTPGDYYKADEEWWKAAYGDGRKGEIYVQDIQHDSITGVDFIGISAPISDPGSEKVIGVLHAIVDLAEMRPIVQRVRLGSEGRALLVKSDGSIISAPGTALGVRQKAEEMEVVASAAAERPAGYTTASLKGGRRSFIGFAGTGLTASFPELKWTVIVTQNLDQVRAPLATMSNRALGTSLAGLLLLGLVAAYCSLHRPQRLTDIEEVTEAGGTDGSE